MISRLDRLQGRDIYENTALAKLNEVIDAVNELQLSIKPILEERKSGIKVCEEAQDMYDNAILDALKDKQVDVVVKPADNSEKANCQENAQDHIADTSKKVTYRMIGCTTLDIPESYKTAPYAEQHKWIGKLCKFWDDDKDCFVFGILDDIDDNHQISRSRAIYFDSESAGWWEHCEPVKPDDDIIYKGDGNE